LKYKAQTKTTQTSVKFDVEGLFNNIGTKLWADSRPPYVPPEGLSTKVCKHTEEVEQKWWSDYPNFVLQDINELWDKLSDAEKLREETLGSELDRLHKLEYYAKKFAGKADLFEQWVAEKREYLVNDDLGNSLHSAQVLPLRILAILWVWWLIFGLLGQSKTPRSIWSANRNPSTQVEGTERFGQGHCGPWQHSQQWRANQAQGRCWLSFVSI
jgi:hypothetical protein